MDYEVKKPINTASRRLRALDPVSAADDLSPHTFAGLVEGGFVGPVPPAEAFVASGQKSDAAALGDLTRTASKPVTLKQGGE